MNKVIKGKRYDTNTAERLGENETGLGRSEELYRKRTGEFFLACWTQWQGEDSRIEPITYKAAQNWAEEHLDGDEYEEIFGAVSEGEKQTVAMSLDKTVIDKLKNSAVDRKISVSELVTRLVNDM